MSPSQGEGAGSPVTGGGGTVGFVRSSHGAFGRSGSFGGAGAFGTGGGGGGWGAATGGAGLGRAARRGATCPAGGGWAGAPARRRPGAGCRRVVASRRTRAGRTPVALL